jgi:hypothetical protein
MASGNFAKQKVQLLDRYEFKPQRSSPTAAHPQQQPQRVHAHDEDKASG